MWPTYYLPSLVSRTPPDTDCWEYLIASGDTLRSPPDGYIADPEITFPIVAGRNYRIVGRISFAFGETVPRGSRIRVGWDITVPVAAFMERSVHTELPQVLNLTSGSPAGRVIRRDEPISEDTVSIAEFPSGETSVRYTNVIVDVYVIAGDESGQMSLKWGSEITSSNDATVRLLEETRLFVKEYE